MASKTLFATNVFHASLGLSAKKLRQIATECTSYRKLDDNGKAWSKKNYPNGYTSYGSLDQIFNLSTTFDELREKLDKKVYAYLKELDLLIPAKELKMSSFWINIMGKNANHSGHIHPMSVLSGTLYISVPKDASPIKLEDPRLPLMMNTPPRTSSFVSVKAKDGDVVIFESWLRHEVPTNLSSKERISLSFNYDWVKT